LLPIAQGQIGQQLAWVLHQMGGGDREALDRLVRALDLLPMDQHDQRGSSAAMYAITLQCLGRTDEALAWISAERDGGTALHPDYVARLLVGQLYAELASGRLTAAADTGRRMIGHGDALLHPLVTGWGHFALARVAYEWNDLAGAREHYEAVLALGRDPPRMCSVNATLGLALTLAAQGQPAEAESLVLAELEQAEEAENSFFVENLRSFMARLALASDDLDRAASWLAGGSFTRQGTTGYDIEDQLLTRARVLVARAASESLDEASAAVDRAIEAAEARHVIASLVQGLALRALVERSRGDIGGAARSMARSLELAEAGRFTRAFVELGSPLTELLVELATHDALPEEGQRVLDVCRAETGVPVSGVPSREHVAPKLAVVLTWRELDVLQLMEARLTATEIAQLLGLPEEAVRQHVANLYSKLQVKGQGDAMSRAYDLGILSAEDR
jgi:ATP/maltotriose-dependent transcriptional regulator MalT